MEYDYERAARGLLYPDLRSAYRQHDAMMAILRGAIEACHKLSFQGGGRPPSVDDWKGNEAKNFLDEIKEKISE